MQVLTVTLLRHFPFSLQSSPAGREISPSGFNFSAFINFILKLTTNSMCGIRASLIEGQKNHERGFFSTNRETEENIQAFFLRSMKLKAPRKIVNIQKPRIVKFFAAFVFNQATRAKGPRSPVPS